MSRAIVNVATGQYAKGQIRLLRSLSDTDGGPHKLCAWTHMVPEGCPEHSERPYAFKAYALKELAPRFDSLLWMDACIVPGARPLSELWEYIEENGVWLARNGWTNYEWTADSAYPDLFTLDEVPLREDGPSWLEEARAVNREIPHVVATAFGISLAHPKGRAFLDEYFRLASETSAFCGPWRNTPETPCGPSDVLGHRHDQTAASVIAWRLGIPLTNCPEWFAYRGGETEKTCLIADGAY